MKLNLSTLHDYNVIQYSYISHAPSKEVTVRQDVCDLENRAIVSFICGVGVSRSKQIIYTAAISRIRLITP